MTKSVFSLYVLASLIFAISVNTVQAQPFYDRVESVKVDGVEVAGAVNTADLPESFWKGGEFERMMFAECSYSYELGLNYANKTLRLEIGLNDNPKSKVENISPAHDYKKSPVKASLSIFWFNLQNFTDSLQLDKNIIDPNMSFEAFRKMFPTSAGHGKTDQEGESHYSVAIGKKAGTLEETPGYYEESPNYDGSVYFVFRNGKLVRIGVNQANSCG